MFLLLLLTLAQLIRKVQVGNKLNFCGVGGDNNCRGQKSLRVNCANLTANFVKG